MEEIKLTEVDWLRLENLQLHRKLHEVLAENLAYKHQTEAANFGQLYAETLQGFAIHYRAEGWTFDATVKGWVKQ